MPWQDGTLKVDTHRHMGGSIAPALVWEMVQEQRLFGLADSLESVQRRMVCQRGERGFRTFLSKFDILNALEWDEASIARSVNQICCDIAGERIDAAEITASVEKYLRSQHKWTRAEVVRYLYDCYQQAADQFDIDIALILSIKMEMDREQQRVVVELIDNVAVADCLAGINLVGDEGCFEVGQYRGVYDNWRSAGKLLLAHVGETGPAANVRAAIEQLKVNRVIHGLAAAREPDILKMAVDNNICFEIALHSGLATGVVEHISEHPLPLINAAGVATCLGTDDPITFGCSLDGEYNLALGYRLIDVATMMQMRYHAIKYSVWNRGREPDLNIPGLIAEQT